VFRSSISRMPVAERGKSFLVMPCSGSISSWRRRAYSGLNASKTLLIVVRPWGIQCAAHRPRAAQGQGGGHPCSKIQPVVYVQRGIESSASRWSRRCTLRPPAAPSRVLVMQVAARRIEAECAWVRSLGSPAWRRQQRIRRGDRCGRVVCPPGAPLGVLRCLVRRGSRGCQPCGN